MGYQIPDARYEVESEYDQPEMVRAKERGVEPLRKMPRAEQIDESIEDLSSEVKYLHQFIDELMNGLPDETSKNPKPPRQVRPFADVLDTAAGRINVEACGVREAISRLRDLLY